MTSGRCAPCCNRPWLLGMPWAMREGVEYVHVCGATIKRIGDAVTTSASGRSDAGPTDSGTSRQDGAT